MKFIERNPKTPCLNKKAKELITELCFRKDDAIEKVDGIFVFSSCIELQALVGLIKKILKKNISKQLFITGGVTPEILSRDPGERTDLTEADMFLNALDLHQFKDIKIFSEKKSTNTLENAIETLKIPEFKKCGSLLFIFKAHAAGRGYLTLRKFFPTARILQKTFETKYRGADKKITRDNWHTFSFGRSRVWGEFLRIKAYGSRGDIE